MIILWRRKYIISLANNINHHIEYYDNVIVNCYIQTSELESLSTVYSFIRGYHAWHHGVVGAMMDLRSFVPRLSD